jgi:sucrose-6F-phosphate phosphohydrolase
VEPFLFITDLDNTLVGDDRAMAELNHQLEQHRQQYGTKIIYSTGRSLVSYRHLRTTRTMLSPDVLIAGVGTAIYHQDGNTPDSRWSEALSKGWNHDEVVATAAHFADLTPQPNTEQSQFKASYYLTEQAAVEVLPQLEAALGDRGLDVQIIYSGSLDLDILPRQANKGKAMTFIREQFGFAPERTVACGDSGNDISMFSDRSECGIVVGNAMRELLEWHHANPNPNRYLAKSYCAGGILEGLRYFGFL